MAASDLRTKGYDIIPVMGMRYTDEDLVQYYKRSATAEEAEPYLEELLGRYRRKVIGWCLSMTSRREEASDLAQEISLKVLTHLSSFRAESRFSTWLYQIVRNHCSDFLKRRQRERIVSIEDSAIGHTMGTSPTIEKHLDRKEVLNVFSQVVNSALTDMERKVAYMHFADGLKLPEITSLLALTNKSGAKAYLVSAKRKLRAQMARWLENRGIYVSELF